MTPEAGQYQPARRTTNPFRHNGKTIQDTLGPLRPHKMPDDADYVVEIDHTGECFAQFEREVTVGGVRIDGRLVLVCGEKGSGKTTLLHRCATGIRERANAEFCLPLIIDLSNARPDPPSIGVRSQFLYRRVIDVLKTRQEYLTHDQLNPLLEGIWVPDPAGSSVHVPPLRTDAYSRVTDLLDPLAERTGNRPVDMVLVVILPPFQDLAEEISLYAKLVTGRVVFLGETLDMRPPESMRQTTLRLGPINGLDAWALAERRLSRDRPVDFPPYTTKADMVDFVESVPNFSVAGVQRVLLHVFEDVIENKPAVDKVTAEHFRDYLLDHLGPDPLGTTGGGP